METEIVFALRETDGYVPKYLFWLKRKTERFSQKLNCDIVIILSMLHQLPNCREQ